MELPRGRLRWAAVALLWIATVGSVANYAQAQANAVHAPNEALDVGTGTKLSPLENRIGGKIHTGIANAVGKDETRVKRINKEPPLPLNVGHHELNGAKHQRRRVISKREAKKPKNTKRRVKFNKKEFEKKLQEQKDVGSDVKTASKADSNVDTSEVLSSSNSLVPESGKEKSGSSSTYESYSGSSDSEDENDIDDDDDDDGDDDDDDGSSEVSDDKTESTEEVSLTSEEEKSKSKGGKTSDVSHVPFSGPESSPPASSDSTDESSGSKAISGGSSEYSEISYTMSSSAEDAFPVEDSSEESKEKEVDSSKSVSKSNEKSKSTSAKSVTLGKKAELKTRKKKLRKTKELILNKKSGKNKVSLSGKQTIIEKSQKTEKQAKTIRGASGTVSVAKKEHSEKLAGEEKNTQRLEMTTGKVLNMADKEKAKNEKHVDLKIGQNYEVTTERVLRMVQNSLQKKTASRNIMGQSSSSNRNNAMTNNGAPASSKEKPRMELLKVKKAEIDPNKKASLEQELLKDYPENGTVEIINWEGTFAPMHGEPYVAPLHHQPDEFWDAIYTSKDPDLPTPPGADVSASAQTTENPLEAPWMNLHRLAGVINPEVNHQRDPSHFGPNHPSEHQADQNHLVDINKIEAKDKNKGEKDKKEKKKPKLTIKEKRKKKKEKKENPRLGAAARVTMSGYDQQDPMIQHSDNAHHNFVSLENPAIHPAIPHVSPNFPGKTGAHVEHIPIKVHAKRSSEENLKTPSEEERESGTTYKPEGAYEYPSFRHPDFNPDTAYDEHGIPIHESPGWTPPPTLPGDNRFGKGRNQAGAGMKNRAPKEQVKMPQVAKSVPQNYHGLQDHLALLEHQKAAETLHGLGFSPFHPTEPPGQFPPLHNLGIGIKNVNHRIRKRKAPESPESLESISEVLYSEELKLSAPLQDQKNAKEIAYGGTRTTRLTKQAWLKNISLSRWRPTGTSRVPRIEPYTGFIFTQRPRWSHPRGYPRFDSYPLPPPHQSVTSLHSTKPPSPHPPPTTPRPPVEMTTEWWPPGVSLGSRPPVSRIPIHVIYPEIAKWEMDRPNVRVRTSGTRFTYAPEVVNYPVTFDWNVPRHLRTDKWTQRPDWPLESPLFSSEAYDYLEEPTLPRILESGETEFPPTSPLPWWTYPPWWLEKKTVETVNGTTRRPFNRKTTSVNIATTFGTTRPTITKAAHGEVAENNQNINRGKLPTLAARIAITQELKRHSKVENQKSQVHKKIHHRGPWWHLTIIEHLTKKPTEVENGLKRVKRSFKLVRQNAIRRKWRNLREKKNLSYTLDLTNIKPVVLTDGNKSPSMDRVLSNFSFTWPNVSQISLSKIYIEKTLIEALNELRNHLNLTSDVSGKFGFYESSEMHTQTRIDVEKHLAGLHNLFLTALDNFSQKQDSSLIFHIFTNEISKEIVKYLLNGTNYIRHQLEIFLSKMIKGQGNGTDANVNHWADSKIVNLFKLLCSHDLIHPNVSLQIKNTLQSIYGRNTTDFLNLNHTYKPSFNSRLSRKKREDIMDITECPFNFSAQSVERVVGEIADEIVEEMSIDEINEEVKTDVMTAMHENQLKRLGKTNINRDVLREMVKLETVDEAKFRNATEASLRKVIMKMVNEVLNTLRSNPWMKDLIIKLFEDGYSVESVLETITNQISIDELMSGLVKDGINITKYQRKLIMEEFKDYKELLRQMLTKEVQLWEYQLLKNESVVRYKRDLSDEALKHQTFKLEKKLDVTLHKNTVFSRKCKTYTEGGGSQNLIKNPPKIFRVKRNINDNEISKPPDSNENVDEYEFIDEELDRELAELKKSSMPKREKMKVLKKRLKGLLSQTENPDDIVFPDNFEEELMRTENLYDEDITQSPPRFKKRIRWNVRTKKPTTKVITYPMKIRLNRGRPFVPLTTTEEQTLIMMVTQTPGRKYKTRKPVATKKALTSKQTSPPLTKSFHELQKQFWLDFTTSPTDYEAQKPRTQVSRMTLKPLRTFATLRTFKTMKFVQKTKQPVISLQEFLKRRNEFNRGKQEGVFNRPLSEEEANPKPKNTRNLSGLSEEEEEEFSFEAKLSAEVNPSVFTFPPTPSTSETTSVIDKPSLESIPSTTEPTVEKAPQKVTRKKLQRRKPATRSNKTGTRRPASKSSDVTKTTVSWTTEVTENTEKKTEDEKFSRRKRDVSFLQTNTDSTKGEEDFNDVTIPPLVISNEKIGGLKKNISRQSLEGRIHLHNWSYGVKQPNEKVFQKNNTDSFETYQQEHKKWFGIQKRGVPVNNFDIDWDQMRGKVEIHQISSRQRQKSSMKPTVGGNQVKKNERIATPLTQATTPLFMDGSEKPSILLDGLYRSALKKSKTKTFAKHYISDESLDDRVKDFSYPPFGKLEKDGHTAFGRLYQGKRHYQLEDSREKHFDQEDLQRLVNQTYNPIFRISTHRKSNWNNRTFDPNYVFTQLVPLPGKARTRTKFNWKEAVDLFEDDNNTLYYFPHTTFIPSEKENVIRRQHQTLEPKLKNAVDDLNATELMNQGNETFAMTRSKRVPWENSTDIETYKTYIRSRKRFYNKTVDIAFSYYIFHKFRCGNKTRDLGYGRMSNVVNRWYNKTFVPKFRPDMFYVRNRYKRGKEFNYFKGEMNEVHATISYGDFDPIKWMQVATEANLDESTKTKRPSNEEKDVKKKRVIEVFTSVFPPKPTHVPETNLRLTTVGLKKVFTTEPLKEYTTKASFFRSVKEKGFGFFRSLFGRQDSNENKD